MKTPIDEYTRAKLERDRKLADVAQMTHEGMISKSTARREECRVWKQWEKESRKLAFCLN